MDKIFFFFTKLNDCKLEKEPENNNFFKESVKEFDNGEYEEKKIGFNHSREARITQLYFLGKKVEYQNTQNCNEIFHTPNPMVFLVCDNMYREYSDQLLNSLFENFKLTSEKNVFCYFHESNSSIKKIVLGKFGEYIENRCKSFHHEEGSPFFELIPLLDVASQQAFDEKLIEIQNTHIGTDNKLKKEKHLSEVLILLHKLLGQSYRLKEGDEERIKKLTNSDFKYDLSLEGLKLLSDCLLIDLN